jgi:hypothetical protein
MLCAWTNNDVTGRRQQDKLVGNKHAALSGVAFTVLSSLKTICQLNDVLFNDAVN